jgi:hypothetical protein
MPGERLKASPKLRIGDGAKPFAQLLGYRRRLWPERLGAQRAACPGGESRSRNPSEKKRFTRSMIMV